MCCENSCLEAVIKCCQDNIIVNAGLTPSTAYVYIVTDSRGNKYTKEFTSDGSGNFTLVATDFPDSLFSEETAGIKLEVKKAHSNLMDAISHGAGDGLKVSLNVIAMLIGVIALIAMIDFLLGKFGMFLFNHTSYDAFLGMRFEHFSLKEILGSVFSVFAWAMGVPSQDTHMVGSTPPALHTPSV